MTDKDLVEIGNKVFAIHALSKMLAKTEIGTPDFYATFDKLIEIASWFKENNISSLGVE